MRKIVGSGLAVLGAFLVVAGLLAQLYAPGQLKKTPLDVDSVTNLQGTAQLSDGEALQEIPVRATSITRVDSEASTSDVVVFHSSTCLVKDVGNVGPCVSAEDSDGRLISASTDSFAADRKTGIAVNDPNALPADATPREGLVNKWPFDAEQVTYPYWDGMISDTVDAVYDRSETVAGVESYVYKIDVPAQEAEVSAGIQGTYSSQREIWVEPVTGSIVKQTEHQERLDSQGSPLLILDLEFTPDQVETSAADAKSNRDKLNLVGSTIPLVGYLLGVPLLILGLGLLFLEYRRTSNTASHR